MEKLIETTCQAYMDQAREWLNWQNGQTFGNLDSGQVLLYRSIRKTERFLYNVEAKMKWWVELPTGDNYYRRQFVCGVVTVPVISSFLRIAVMNYLYEQLMPRQEDVFSWLRANAQIAARLLTDFRTNCKWNSSQRLVLADALEDAGCGHKQLMDHLRTCKYTSDVIPFGWDKQWCWTEDFLMVSLYEYEKATDQYFPTKVKL